MATRLRGIKQKKLIIHSLESLEVGNFNLSKMAY